MTEEENMINYLKYAHRRWASSDKSCSQTGESVLEAILISCTHGCHPGVLLMPVLFPLLKPVPIK